MFSESSADYQVFIGGIDERIERCLWHLEDEPKKDVAAELGADFDLDEIMVARESLFKRAAYMAERRAEMQLEGPYQSDQDTAYKGLDNPWSMIKRRALGLACMDVCDLYVYMMNKDCPFPTRILKRKTLTPKNGFEAAIACDLSKISEANESMAEREAMADNNDAGNGRYGMADDDTNRDIDDDDKQDDERPTKEATGVFEKNEDQIDDGEDVTDNPDDRRNDEGRKDASTLGEMNEYTSVENVNVLVMSNDVIKEAGKQHENVDNENDTMRDTVTEDNETQRDVPDRMLNVLGNLDETVGAKNVAMSDPINDCNEAECFMSDQTVKETDNQCESVHDGFVEMSDLVTGHNEAKRAPGKGQEREQSDMAVTECETIPVDEHAYAANLYSNRALSMQPEDDVWEEFQYNEESVKEHRYTLFDELPDFDDNINLIRVLIMGEEKPANSDVVGHGEGNKETGTLEMDPREQRAPCTRESESGTPEPDPALLICSSSKEEPFSVRVTQPTLSDNTLKKDSTSAKLRVTQEESLTIGTTTTKQQCKGRNMATQTTPNVIPDGPVSKTEFQTQVEYLENALIDHERRMRIVEMSRNKNDRKVDRIDADYFNQNQHVLGIQAAMNEEVRTLRLRLDEAMTIITRMQENTERKGNPIAATDEKGTDNQNDFNVGGDVQPPEQQKPQPSNEERRGARPMQKKEPKQKPESSYESFMRAASKVVPAAASLTDYPNIPNQPTNMTPKPQRPSVRNQTANKNQGRRTDGQDRRQNKGNASQHSVTTSTPIPAAQNMEFSWADEENEDSKTIEKFLEVEKGKKGEREQKPKTAKGGPRATSARRVSFAESSDENRSHQDRSLESSYEDDFPILPVTKGMKRLDGSTHGNPTEVTARREVLTEQAGQAPIDLGAQAAAPVEAPEPVQPATNVSTNVNKNFNGARPKVMSNTAAPRGGRPRSDGKAGATLSNETPRRQPAARPSPTYADMAAEEPWLTAEGKNRKRKLDKRSPKAIPPLQGAVVKPQRDVFVRGLATTGYSSKKEMGEAIRVYCEERGVAIVYARIMVNANEPGVANVKITVHEEDIDTILDPEFWPAESYVREWFANGRGRRNSAAGFDGRGTNRENGDDNNDA